MHNEGIYPKETYDDEIYEDESYDEIVQKYSKMDGIVAIIFYLYFVLSMYLLILVAKYTGIFFGVLNNIVLVTIVIKIVLKRNQGLSSVGISKKNLGKSVLLGFILSFLFIVVPNLSLFSQNITSLQFYGKVIYFFINIAFTEELLFRGYIQTRIYGLIKSYFVAVFVVGLMFAIIHLPIDLVKYQIDFITYLNIVPFRLPKIVIIHALLNLLYRKYNSIAAPIILHGFIDLLWEDICTL